MLSKYPRSERPTPVSFIAVNTRCARFLSNGWRRSSVLATGSSIASAGMSLSVGCRAAESSMLSAPTSRANCSHSSIARSGSLSRISRGVSSCRAAVRTLIFMPPCVLTSSHGSSSLDYGPDPPHLARVLRRRIGAAGSRGGGCPARDGTRRDHGALRRELRRQPPPCLAVHLRGEPVRLEEPLEGAHARPPRRQPVDRLQLGEQRLERRLGLPLPERRLPRRQQHARRGGAQQGRQRAGARAAPSSSPCPSPAGWRPTSWAPP